MMSYFVNFLKTELVIKLSSIFLHIDFHPRHTINMKTYPFISNLVPSPQMLGSKYGSLGAEVKIYLSLLQAYVNSKAS